MSAHIALKVLKTNQSVYPILQSSLIIALSAERRAEKAAETVAGSTLSPSLFYQRCQGFEAFGAGRSHLKIVQGQRGSIPELSMDLLPTQGDENPVEQGFSREL